MNLNGLCKNRHYADCLKECQPENDGEKGEDPNLHISIEEMEKDIADTELEIEALRHDLASAEISRDRWGIMKAETGIRQREEFVEKLKKYLDIRKSK